MADQQEPKNLISADELLSKTQGLVLGAIGTGNGFVGELLAQSKATPTVRNDPKLKYN